MEKLRAAFAADACAIGFYECARGRGRYLWTTGVRQNLVQAYVARLAASNPWIRPILREGRAGQAWLGQRLVPLEHLVQTEFYEQWLQPQGLRHYSFGIAWRTRDQLLCLEHYRRADREPFSQRDLVRYARFLPHVSRSWDVGRRIHLEEVEQSGSGARAPSWSPPTASGGNARRRAGDRAVSARSLKPTLDTAERARWRCSVSMTPDFQRSSAEDRLRLLYQLTRAEARLAVLLGRGLTLREAAVQLNVEMTTVRTHVQRIYDKTGTHHQSALVHLLLSGPAGWQQRR